MGERKREKRGIRGWQRKEKRYIQRQRRPEKIENNPPKDSHRRQNEEKLKSDFPELCNSLMLLSRPQEESAILETQVAIK